MQEQYRPEEIESKVQLHWDEKRTFEVTEDESKEKYYCLSMLPYPSGRLHMGHVRNYTIGDVIARYQRMLGKNVLQPIGWDAFGLPAEGAAVKNNTAPAPWTYDNIAYMKNQLKMLGFGYDWSRELATCTPEYYRWEQKFFTELYKKGLVYKKTSAVNWCPNDQTVLANEQVIDGCCWRCDTKVERKEIPQWFIKITAYADELLNDLDKLDHWPDTVKTMQRNWIGRSQGADVKFDVKDSDLKLEIFTTRPDTIFGVSFMVLAPESDYVKPLTTPEQADAVAEYLDYVSKRTERERQTEVKKVTGVFTGSYAINPFTNEAIPIWISEYVLSGYGTGAIMAVPGHDSRDYAFAKHFNLPIVPVIDDGEGHDMSESSYDAKAGKMINSGIINGMEVKEAIAYIAGEVEKRGIGKSKINYRLRDAIFSRQRYWGEPFPVYYKDDLPYMLDESKLPLELPEVDKYLPTESGEPPLGRAKNWKTEDGYPLELNTMPGFAGSSAYFLRYMDPHNNNALVDHEICNYWKNVDLYLGGSEHATGHLIYARFWNMFLYDLGVACEEEPFKKLINQGMIQGRSNFVYRIQGSNTFVSVGLKDQYKTTEIHVDVNIVKNDVLDQDAFRAWMPEYANAEFILENGKYICGWAIEKMSKSMFNVVNPDTIIEEYGADTLRLYEMFLGPLEFSKPWDTQGIDGVYKFLRKFWRLFQVGENFSVSDETPSKEELKVLHKTIKKVEYDIENFSFNTSIPAFMICTNELTALKCNKRAILEPLVITIAPFAPHMAEELWSLLGHTQSITKETFPQWEEKFLTEDTFEYPVSFNGKVRFKLSMPLTATNADIEAAVKAAPESTKWLEGKEIKKMIIVPKKIVNVVMGATS